MHAEGIWPCDNVRREWRTLNAQQQASYISAINTLVASGTYTSWLNTHIDITMDVCSCTLLSLFFAL